MPIVLSTVPFASAAKMAAETMDACTNKEQDCAAVCLNGSHAVELCDGEIIGPPELVSSEEGSDGKVYVVKECMVDNLGVKSEVGFVETCRNGKIKHEAGSQEARAKSRPSVKDVSRDTVAKVQAKYTVPQPFSLATEKRASNGGANVSGGTHNGGSEAGSVLSKGKVRPARHPGAAMSKQVTISS